MLKTKVTLLLPVDSKSTGNLYDKAQFEMALAAGDTHKNSRTAKGPVLVQPSSGRRDGGFQELQSLCLPKSTTEHVAT